jgi:hypothetical protein
VAYKKLMEATKLLASAVLPLLAEDVEELAVQVELQKLNQFSLRHPFWKAGSG